MPDMSLHQEYGVNPTVGVCFYCHQETGEVGLLGYNGGKEAPHYAILSMEPCSKCKEYMTKGIIFVEAIQRDGQTVPIGGYAVVREEAVRRLISDETLLADILEKKMAFLEPEVWDKMGLPREEINNL